MKGSCIIDGIDIADFGMFILKGGDYDFLSFPERKEPVKNNWHEYDGVDADLSEIYFKEKKVTVRFYIKADTAEGFIDNLNAFYDLISAPGYRRLYSREFDKTFSLRYISCPEYSHRGGLYKQGAKRGEINVEFSMDDPLCIFSGASHLEPRSGRPSKTYVELNGYDLASFGIIVNQCYNTDLRLPVVKSPLTRSISNTNGLIVYPSRETTFETKQIVIESTMMADSRESFYYNYEALFNNLNIKDEILLSTYAEDIGGYYQSMTDFKKMKPFKDGIHVTFNLNLINLYPGIQKRAYVLGTEDGNILGTENLKALEIEDYGI